ncbi:uncharacterized protein [Musca autumnalis]|uniref:uncharacterized protein n=1 Tax=Musca autumnalis TaxID=221902 RepID=UPI003CED46B2
MKIVIMKLKIIGILVLLAATTGHAAPAVDILGDTVVGLTGQTAPVVDILTNTVGGITGGLLGTLDTLLGGNRKQPEQHIHIYVDQQQLQPPSGTSYYVPPGQAAVVEAPAPQYPQYATSAPMNIPRNWKQMPGGVRGNN